MSQQQQRKDRKVEVLVNIQRAIEDTCTAILTNRPSSLDNQYGCSKAYEDNEIRFIVRGEAVSGGFERRLMVNGWGARPEESVDQLVCDAASLSDGPARASLLAQLTAWGWMYV